MYRQEDVISNCVNAGICDRVPDARKSARRLFWALYGRSNKWRNNMQNLLRNMDAQVRKSVISECFPHVVGNPGILPIELRDILLKLRPSDFQNEMDRKANLIVNDTVDVVKVNSSNSKSGKSNNATTNSKGSSKALSTVKMKINGGVTRTAEDIPDIDISVPETITMNNNNLPVRKVVSDDPPILAHDISGSTANTTVNSKKPLSGVPRERPAKMANMPKTLKRPERPYGGVLCSKCTRELLKERTRGDVQ